MCEDKDVMDAASQVNPYFDKVVLSRDEYSKLLHENNRLQRTLDMVKWDLRYVAGSVRMGNTEGAPHRMEEMADKIQEILASL